MAKRNYLVEGLSGAGKSSVYEELIRRGYTAVSTDRAWKSRADRAMWDEQRAVTELERAEPDVLFVCGSSSNRDRFLPHFRRVFNLRIDDDTMRRRLEERTNNDYGKHPEELELMLRLNRSGERPAGAIDVDATRPLPEVVDELLRLAGCPERSDSAPVPWSKRGSAFGRSFVVAESALPFTQADEAIASLEYSWSGDVLAALLRYLAEQGIDLMDAARDSVLVLTSEHRARYLARLDPAAFDGSALRRFYEERNGTTAEGVEYALLDGVAFLRDTLELLQPGMVAVVVGLGVEP
jgi:hypothetical protein